MIGKLTGIVDEKETASMILNVGGVGYHVHCSAQTLALSPPAGEKCQLFIETLVQENAIKLVGFFQAEERSLFNVLLTVQGVGMRLALTILGFFPSLSTLAERICQKDEKALSAVPGVGKKLALRITSELAEKMQGLNIRMACATSLEKKAGEDAVEALVALGFSRTLVIQSLGSIMDKVDTSRPLTSQDIIRVGLKVLNHS